MNIALILQSNAAKFSDRTAIVEAGRRISFVELDRAAARAAQDLRRAGVARGMRALVFSPMSIDLYTTMIGLFRLGATAVFVDPSAGTSSLSACIERVRPDAFVAVPKAHLLRMTSAAARRIPIKVFIGPRTAAVRRWFSRDSFPAAHVEPCDAETPAIITFTSGTTGDAKATVRSHGFLMAQHQALVESLALKPREVDLTTLPIFVLANLASGVTSIIPDANLKAPGSIDPVPVLDQIRAERPTRMVASPALLQRLVKHVGGIGSGLDTFERIFTGGAPVFPRTLDEIKAVAGKASVTAVYGSTEAEPIASIDLRDISEADRVAMRQGAGVLAGSPIPSIQVRVLPDRWGQPIEAQHQVDFDREILSADCAGEIVVSGDHVLSGYLDGVGNRDTKIAVGNRVWHRTGDAGYFDRRGRLWLLGRCSAKVVDDSGVLYPLAVECAASDVEGVRRSALVQHRGERVLVVETDRDVPLLRETLLRRLAWARLVEVIAVSRIPVDHRHNAKTDLAALIRMLDGIEIRSAHPAFVKSTAAAPALARMVPLRPRGTLNRHDSYDTP